MGIFRKKKKEPETTAPPPAPKLPPAVPPTVVVPSRSKKLISVLPIDLQARMEPTAGFTYKCPVCGKEYKTVRWFDNHMETKHPEWKE